MQTTKEGQDIVSGIYEDYVQTQTEIFDIEVRKTRKAIFWVGGLIFASSMLTVLITNSTSTESLIDAVIFPAVFIGLGFLALKQPMLSAILAILLFVLIITLSVLAYGARGAYSGILVKAIVVYFLIAAFKSAREAGMAKKNIST